MEQNIASGKKAFFAKTADLTQFIDAIPDPIVFINMKGEILSCNELFIKSLRISKGKEETLKGNVFDFVAKRDLDRARSDLESAIKVGPIGGMIYTITRADGSEFPAEISVKVSKQNGDFLVTGTFKDVTEKKLMEDALHASEEKYRQLHESIRDGFGSVAMDGRLLEFNKAYQDMLGYEKEELLKLKYTDLTPEKWRVFESDIIIKQVLPRGYSDVYEKEYRRKDGTILPVELRTVLLKDNEGKNIAMWAIVRDITERKHAEERLRAASVYARSLIESSLDPLVTISADGKITDANKATEDVTGRSRGDLIGSDFSYYFTEPKKAREGYELVFSKGFVKDYPLVIRHKSGRVTDVLYNAAIYRNEAGETQGVFAAAKDVTELNLALENLKRSNLELEQFAYVASHDLQEPLRMVTSYMQLLERRYKGKLDADADEFIAYAVDGASHMQGLINDLLAYSRVSSQGKPFEPTDCDSVIDAVLKTLQMTIEESGAVVTHDKLPVAMADETQLFTLFQNLISNAVKFHGKEPPRIHVSAKPQGEEFLFSVRDNGIGIAPEYFDRLFKIFQRLHTKEEYPGTGIGLAVCKRIVERHGGQIWLESQVGKGTTFYFTLNNKKGEKRER